jgi:hypothetical protein
MRGSGFSTPSLPAVDHDVERAREAEALEERIEHALGVADTMATRPPAATKGRERLDEPVGHGGPPEFSARCDAPERRSTTRDSSDSGKRRGLRGRRDGATPARRARALTCRATGRRAGRPTSASRFAWPSSSMTSAAGGIVVPERAHRAPRGARDRGRSPCCRRRGKSSSTPETSAGRRSAKASRRECTAACAPERRARR